jgi:hypothetical protein
LTILTSTPSACPLQRQCTRDLTRSFDLKPTQPWHRLAAPECSDCFLRISCSSHSFIPCSFFFQQHIQLNRS